jgi:oxygen-dependent protoporphyrinogen oxidase
MPDQPTKPKRIAIIGGGISGLAAAHRVAELEPTAEVVLFERGDRLGGIVRTIRKGGFLIETSADSFITSVPSGIDLCRRIGFADQLIPTEPQHRGAMVVCRGKLERVPDGFVLMAPQRLGPVLRSPILSLRGKLRLASERFVKARADGGDESLASFARRRLGREAFERLVQPLVGGIYTADPEKLSLAATLPRYLDMERQHGGLIRAARAQRKAGGRSQRSGIRDQESGVGGQESGSGFRDDSGARYSMFVAPREGLSSFAEALAARFPAGCVQLNCAIERMERVGDRWRLLHRPTVSVGSGQLARSLKPETDALPTDTVGLYNAVIVAASAPAAANLLQTVDKPLAAELSAIEYAGSAIVVLGYDRSQIAHPLDSFGFVVPAIEKRRILSASFSSVKFSGRAPAGKMLVRVFLGGALQPEMLELPDDQLHRIAEEELRDLLGISGAPCLSLVFRWPRAMPQYHLGHLDRLRRINDRLTQLPGLALAGNAYEGVGIPQCIRSGEQAAEKALLTIRQNDTSPGVATPGL